MSMQLSINFKYLVDITQAKMKNTDQFRTWQDVDEI